MAESDQCAFDLDGTLKDMLEIDFNHDPDDPPLMLVKQCLQLACSAIHDLVST